MCVYACIVRKTKGSKTVRRVHSAEFVSPASKVFSTLTLQESGSIITLGKADLSHFIHIVLYGGFTIYCNNIIFLYKIIIFGMSDIVFPN
jgi:hypothetical protein